MTQDICERSGFTLNKNHKSKPGENYLGVFEEVGIFGVYVTCHFFPDKYIQYSYFHSFLSRFKQKIPLISIRLLLNVVNKKVILESIYLSSRTAFTCLI